jgi:serine/threonine protein kinase
VKPSNVQLCDGGRVVLTDFGIASTTGEGSTTPTGEIVGSPAYMAPERIHGGNLAPASDLFSLGATLYAAVEGRSPFG